MDTQYIYALLDDEDKPFYVGKTHSLNRRYSGHLALARKGAVLPVCCKIRKILKEGKSFSISILEVTNSTSVDAQERYWIKTLRAEGFRLFNLAEGGEGGCTSESARKGVETKRKNGTLSMSAETRARQSAAAKGKPKSEEHKASLRRAWKRTPEQQQRRNDSFSQSQRGHINIKKFICTSPDGVEYVTERGLSEFCREHSLSAPNMHRILAGRAHTHKGWTIRRLEEKNVPLCQS